MERRDILKVGAAAAGLGFPAIIRAQQKEVVILGIWPQTGAFSDVGPILDRGMRMALWVRFSHAGPPKRAADQRPTTQSAPQSPARGRRSGGSRAQHGGR